MTDETARTVATGVMAGLGLAAAYYVYRQPRLRRVAVAALTTALTTTIPAYLFREVRHAWIESGRQSPA